MEVSTEIPVSYPSKGTLTSSGIASKSVSNYGSTKHSSATSISVKSLHSISSSNIDNHTKSQTSIQTASDQETIAVQSSQTQKLLENELKFEDQRKLAKLLGEEDEPWYSSALSSKLTIGTYRQDRNTQTESEILELKELISTARMLDKSNDEISNKQNDVNCSIKQYYEQQIAKTSNMIYARVNNALEKMDHIYKEEISHIRRAKRQELDNALSKVKDEYVAYYEAELKKRLKEVSKQGVMMSGDGLAENGNLDDGDLRERLEFVMNENAQLREQLEFNQTPQVIVDTAAADKANAQNKKMQGEMAKVQTELENTRTELVKAKEDLQKLEAAKKKLQAQVKAEQEQNKKLQNQIRDLEKKMAELIEENRKQIERMKKEHSQEIANLNTDWERKIKAQADEYNKQITELKEKALAQITSLEIELTNAEKQNKNLNSKLGMMNKNLQNMHDEKEKATAQARKAENDAAVNNASPPADGDVRAANKRIQELEQALDKSRREFERANRNWEKRFAVLRSSMHEIKNESFIRRRLEHQPMALATAKVQYRSQSQLASNPNFPMRDLPRKDSIKPLTPLRSLNERRSLEMKPDIRPNSARHQAECGSDRFSSDEEEVPDSTTPDADVNFIKMSNSRLS